MALTIATSMAKNCLVLPSSISGQTLRSSALNTASLSFVPAKQCYPLVYCGRGDRRTKKGKRFNHSYGNSRPRDNKKGRGLPATPMPPRPPRKDPFDDGEKIEIEIDADLL